MKMKQNLLKITLQTSLKILDIFSFAKNLLHPWIHDEKDQFSALILPFWSNPDFLIQIQIISGPISWKKSGSRPKSGKTDQMEALILVFGEIFFYEWRIYSYLNTDTATPRPVSIPILRMCRTLHVSVFVYVWFLCS